MTKKLWFLPLFLFTGLLAFLTAGGCSKKKLDYSNQEMIEMVLKEDPGVTLLLPDKEYPAIDCKNYSKGCMYGLTMKTHGLVFIMVRFETLEDAQWGAKYIKGLYFYNWVFDDVVGEPVLEDFIQKVFEAKSPFPQPTPTSPAPSASPTARP